MYYNFFIKIFKNFIFKLCDTIFEETKYFLNKNEKKLIFLHFLKSQEVIKIYVFVLIFLVNFLSIVLYQKSFKNLAKYEIHKIFKLLSIFNFIQSEKVFELVHALGIITIENNEKIKKIIHGEQKKINDYEEIENVVIGSGPSGSVSALELKKHKKDVLLIEKGYNYNIPQKKHSGDEFLKKWAKSGLSSTLGPVKLQYASGSCLGGGSEINSGLFHEIDEEFINKIYDNKKKYYKLALKYQADYLTDNYDINKTSDKFLNELKKFYSDSSKKLGWKIENLKRFYSNSGSQYVKNSMTNSLIDDYVKLNGKILLGFELIKVEEYKKKLCKITIVKNGKEKIIICHNLFLCCGAPYTLQLLHKNKLIDKSINNNFHFHPMVKIIAKFNERVNSKKNMEIINSQITEFYPKYIIGNAASGSQFLKIATYTNKLFYEDVTQNSDYMSIFHCTFSLGSSKFTYLPLLNEPIIKYKLSLQDITTLKAGIENLVKFAFSCGAEYIYFLGNKIKKLENFLSLDLKNIKMEELNLSSVHLLGGLKMGGDKKFCIDIGGKLKNTHMNIYVNDSTLISEKLLKNPQNAIMTIAKININIFLEKNENS